MLRKCICMIVTVALVVCVSVAPVGASDISGSFSVLFVTNSSGSVTLDFPRSGSKIPIIRYNSDSPATFYGNLTFDLSSLIFDVSSFSVPAGGSVGLYFSWCGSVNSPFSSESSSLSYKTTYSLANTSSFVSSCDVSRFNFSTGVSGSYPFEGVNVSCRIEDVDVLTALSVTATGSGVNVSSSSGFPGPVVKTWYLPSLSLVSTESSADLDALESVADQIAEGNEIARAMYADIMNALNALKDDTALMASYINDCLIYLNSIETATIGTYNLCAAYLHNLADIAQTAEDIEAELESFHTDFMSKLDLLIGTITSESDDIQATMDRIYEQLIAWLETNFKEAISPEFEGSNSDLSQGIANNDAIEQEWTGSLSDTWTAMHIADFSFDPSFTSGFMWVSGWFSNIYNSLGLYGSIVILPLIIGICKLLLGYFRFAGHGHSKGGGDVDA